MGTFGTQLAAGFRRDCGLDPAQRGELTEETEDRGGMTTQTARVRFPQARATIRPDWLQKSLEMGVAMRVVWSVYRVGLRLARARVG